MKSILRGNLNFLLTHLLACILSLLLTLVFGFVAEWFGMAVYSAITSVMYVCMAYSDAWNVARKETRSYNAIKASPVRALMACIALTAVSVALAALVCVPAMQYHVNIVARTWFCMFLGFFPDSQTGMAAVLQWYEIAACGLVYPLTAFCGYAVGMTGFSVTDKILAKLKFKPRKRRIYK